MLWNTLRLGEFAIDATDGQIGSVVDCLFDDQNWAVRWFVIDTGTWLTGRRVLLPPHAMRPGEERRVLSVELTRDQVKNSPDIDADAPVSRQHENALFQHYGWAPFWEIYPMAGGAAPTEPLPTPDDVLESERETGDPHLRSTQELTNYYVRARDGDIGHVEAFLLDPEEWMLRYAIVDTRNWLPGKRVLVLPSMIHEIDYGEGFVRIDMVQDDIRNGPEYDPNSMIDRSYEERYHSHHGYPAYW